MKTATKTKKQGKKAIATIFLIFMTFTGFVIFQSCSGDDDNGQEPEPEEFIAEDGDFDDYMNWVLEATTKGANPALGDMAHGGQDTTAIRDIYFKNGQNHVNGIYPIGTMIVKHAHHSEETDFDEFTAMVKRGGDFNPDANDWEWFMLEEDGTIAQRGAMGMCISCHDNSNATDYVFSK